MEEMKYEYWWAAMPRAYPCRLKAVAEEAGSTRRLYEAGKEELQSIEGISESYADDIISKRKDWDIDREYEKFLSMGIGFIPWYDERYPRRLKEVSGHPFAIFSIGRLPDDDKPSVAIVGSRNCSEYGRMTARNFGSELASLGVQVVSGMAYGIDGLSQSAALEAGGDSFGVLGCGVNICYPRSNRKLYDRLKEQGGILSEYGIYTKPQGNLFPARNRIISALSDVLIVVEAREVSGTMITVDMALEQGREVAVVPGRITDPLSTGCIKLWKQGAVPVTCAGDVLSLLGSGYDGAGIKYRLPTMELPDDERKVYMTLEPYAKSVGEISDATGMELRNAICALVELCIKGLAGEASTGYYVRAKEIRVV
ncbi:MAG: DNA-processing protein DprA [Lachnospiraceae bacterium]|nr:DNA-processing protein DprA [Lachnospiraceae bacterium]MBR5766785.1 DNA-processing protein DprA [Lachnospiraceae bacterium]MBR6486999.1 DNA-processing protein DprA [Lachnospiraceae bacterium]